VFKFLPGKLRDKGRMWTHAGPHDADCPIHKLDPMSDTDMGRFRRKELRINPNVKGGIEEISPEEAEKNRKAALELSLAQFRTTPKENNVIKVDFKNRKRIE